MKKAEGLSLKVYVKGGARWELENWVNLMTSLGATSRDCQMVEGNRDVIIIFDTAAARDRFVPRLKTAVREKKIDVRIRQWLSQMEIHNKDAIYKSLKGKQGVQLLDKGSRIHLLQRNEEEQVTRSVNFWLNSPPDDIATQVATTLSELTEDTTTPPNPLPPPPQRRSSRRNNPRQTQIDEELEEGEIAAEDHDFAFSPGPIDSPFKQQKPNESGIPRRGASKTPVQLFNSFEGLETEVTQAPNAGQQQQAPTQWGPTPTPKPKPAQRPTYSAERGNRTRSPPPPSWPRDKETPPKPRDGGRGAWRRDDWGGRGRGGARARSWVSPMGREGRGGQ